LTPLYIDHSAAPLNGSPWEDGRRNFNDCERIQEDQGGGEPLSEYKAVSGIRQSMAGIEIKMN